MPQYPNAAVVGKKPDNTLTTLNTNAAGTLATATSSTGDPAVPTLNSDGGLPVHVKNVPGSDYTLTKNITAATLIKGTAGVVGTVCVVVKGSGNGTLNDCATTGAAAASNAFFALDDTATSATVLNIPCGTGIVVTPGTGQTIAITWK